MLLVLNAYSPTDIQVFEIWKYTTLLKDVLNRFDENVFVFVLEIGTNVLMNAHNIYFAFFGNLQNLVDFIEVDSKFAFWASSDGLVGLARPQLWVDSDEYFFLGKLVPVSLQSRQSAYV